MILRSTVRKFLSNTVCCCDKRYEQVEDLTLIPWSRGIVLSLEAKCWCKRHCKWIEGVRFDIVIQREPGVLHYEALLLKTMYNDLWLEMWYSNPRAGCARLWSVGVKNDNSGSEGWDMMLWSRSNRLCSDMERLCDGCDKWVEGWEVIPCYWGRVCALKRVVAVIDVTNISAGLEVRLWSRGNRLCFDTECWQNRPWERIGCVSVATVIHL